MRSLPIVRVTQASVLTLPSRPADGQPPVAGWEPVPLRWFPAQNPKALLEGFCAEPRQEDRIAVNSNGIMLFLRLADIEWAEAGEQGVDLHVAAQTHRLRGTLATIAGKLPPGAFLQASPSTLVNIARIKQLKLKPDGIYEVLLLSGVWLNRHSAGAAPRDPLSCRAGRGSSRRRE